MIYEMIFKSPFFVSSASICVHLRLMKLKKQSQFIRAECCVLRSA